MELELICVAPDGTRNPVVAELDRDTAVGALRAALTERLTNGNPAAGPLYLGRNPLPDNAIALDTGLAHGTVVGLGRPADPAHAPAATWELAVVGGLHGGLAVPLSCGHRLPVGRRPDAYLTLPDPQVSWDHAVVSVHATEAGVIEIELVDNRSRNGVRHDGWRLTGSARLDDGNPVGLGETRLQARPVPPADANLSPDPAAGAALFNRPPRILPSEQVSELLVPVPPEAPAGFRFPWLSMLLPLLLGGALYLLFPNAGYWLLIMAASPLMALANLIGDRRGRRRAYRVRSREYRKARAAFTARLRELTQQEQQRRRAAHPDPGWLVRLAEAPGARLWERRRGDPDFLHVRVGLHDRPATMRLRPDPVAASGTGQVDLPEHPAMFDVPVAVDVRAAGVVGVAGPRDSTLATARAMLSQVAALHAPADLTVVVITGPDQADDWEWSTWLPHVRPGGADFDCRRLVATDVDQAEARLADLRRVVDQRATGRRTGRVAGQDFLVVVDGARRLRGLPGLAELLAAGPEVGVYAICLDAERTALPDECRATLVTTTTRATLHRLGAEPVPNILVDGLADAAAASLARGLAPIRTLGNADGARALPDRVRYTELANLPLSGDPESDADLIAAGWARGTDGRSTRALLGVGPDGPVTVDLRRHGPHTLVAGTSGAGKSELLQTLVAGLALTNLPDALTFVLVDYKGGSAFAACAELPHCVGMVTDLDGHLVDRALASLSAELRHRETLLAEAGAKDIEDYWARTTARLPRLVIVVDEFASLVEEIPEFIPGVIGIGMRGRSLGVHVVLATQRPGGVVTADLRANLNLRICLRVTSDAESHDVIDSPDAARVTTRQPGRALVRTGHGELTPFQTARIGWPRSPANAAARPDQPVEVSRRRVTELGRPGEPRRGAAMDPDAEGSTDLSTVVAAVQEAARRQAVDRPRRAWLPPLPGSITVADLPDVGGTPTPLRVVLGLTDRPDRQEQAAFVLDLERTGPVAVGGTGRTGRSTVLRTLAAELARAAPPDTVHLYPVDCGNRALTPLAALPHVGAVVDVDDPARVGELLDWLDAEVGRRQRMLAAAGSGSLAEHRASAPPDTPLPYLVLLIDRMEAFVGAFAERDGGRLLDKVEGLLRRGAAVGLTTVITTDRTGFTHRVAAAVEHRLVLRQAVRDDMATFGLSPRDVPTRMPAGRAVWTATGEEVQVALLDRDPAASAQARAVRRLGDQLRVRWSSLDQRRLPRRFDPLPSEVTSVMAEELRGTARPTGALVCTPAVGGHHLAPIDIDLADCGGTFVVAGPPRSGRSTALAAMVRSLAGLHAGELTAVVLTPRPSPLRQLSELAGVRLVADLGEARLAGLLSRSDPPAVLVVDDAELVTDPELGDVLERFARSARDHGTALLAAATTEDLLVSRFRGWLAQARRSRCGLLLNPASNVDGEVFELRLPRSTSGGLPPGRGLLVRRGATVPVQVPLAATAMAGSAG